MPIGPEAFRPISPEGEYGKFAELVRKIQGVVYSESQRMLPGKKFRKPPSYLICPTDVFTAYIGGLKEAGMVDTGHRGSEFKQESAEIVWSPEFNLIIIPERLVAMSQDADVLRQMDAKMKLAEDILHAVTTVEDPKTHSLRTGYASNMGYPVDTGMESGNIYVASEIPEFGKSPYAPEGEEPLPVPSEHRTLTETATTLLVNMMFPKICETYEYPTMQLALTSSFGDFEYDIPLNANKAAFGKIFQALYSGDLSILGENSFTGETLTHVRRGNTTNFEPTQTTVKLSTVMQTLRRCRMLRREEIGRKELDVYDYHLPRSTVK